MPSNMEREISELHLKTNGISDKLSNLDGRLDGTLEHLATKTDIEKMKNEIGDVVSTSIEKHSINCPAQARARNPSKSPPPAAPVNGANTKVVIALTSVITSAVAALVAVIYKLIG